LLSERQDRAGKATAVDELIKIAGFVCLVLLAVLELAVVLRIFTGPAPRLRRQMAKRQSAVDKAQRERERVGKIEIEE